MNILITGGAGFVASNLTESLLKDGHSILSIDNFSLGQRRYLKPFENNHNFSFKEVDLLNLPLVIPLFKEVDLVFHLSSNSDIFEGVNSTDRDINLGTRVTYNVLEAMRLNGVKKIIFASTSAVYGVAKEMPTTENYGPLFPISLYGASKVACETLISAFCHNYSMGSWIFRFGNVIGKNPTHGIVFDLIKKLKNNPHELEVLGNGKQAKPYIHIGALIDGMLFGFLHSQEEVNYFNLACEGTASVEFIVATLLKRLGMEKTKIRYTGGEQGWKGDVPQVKLSVEKMSALGWMSDLNSEGAVSKGIGDIISQLW